MGAPVRFQKAVSRSKENAAVERREARRSALWAGNPVRRRERPCRKAGQRARRSAPANFGAPLPSDGDAKGSKPTIWHDSPPGCAARQRSRSGQQLRGDKVMSKLQHQTSSSTSDAGLLRVARNDVDGVIGRQLPSLFVKRQRRHCEARAAQRSNLAARWVPAAALTWCYPLKSVGKLRQQFEQGERNGARQS